MDILSTWGCVLLDDSFSSLFKYPDRTDVNFTNYAERDGITPDLRKCGFKPKSVSLNFLMKHSSESDFWAKYQAFFTDMAAAGYRTAVPGNGMTYRLRYDRTAGYRSPNLHNAGNNITVFTLNFIEDDHSIPLGGSPSGGIPITGYYGVNGIDFGAFGVHPDGEIGAMLHYPDVKEPFTDGQTIDLDTRRIKHKEITLPLWMVAASQSEFVNNCSAFFAQFAQPGKQSLYIREIGGTTYVYYTGCTSFSVFWGQKPGAKFSIRLTVPVVTWLDGTERILTVLFDPTYGALADENGRLLTLT
ncbi:MAG: hypothetical protein LBV32_03155 [Tannerellaceae bacterium]|nr:hypothetical protein [Tannerellaceae bacterium]